MDMKVRQKTTTQLIVPVQHESPHSALLAASAMRTLACQGHSVASADIRESYDPNYLSDVLIITITNSEVVDLGVLDEQAVAAQAHNGAANQGTPGKDA